MVKPCGFIGGFGGYYQNYGVVHNIYSLSKKKKVMAEMLFIQSFL